MRRHFDQRERIALMVFCRQVRRGLLVSKKAANPRCILNFIFRDEPQD